jgi:hypothetical protein
MKTLIGSLILVGSLISASDLGYAQVAAATSEVPDCISLAPGALFPGNPIGSYTVFVADVAALPVPGAIVTLAFTAGAAPLIAWCGGVVPGPVAGITDAFGFVTLALPMGGGCIPGPMPCVAAAAVVTVEGPPGIGGVFAEGILCVNSPDVVDVAGVPPGCPATSTCVGGFTVVGLADAVFHTFPITLGLVELCTDFTPPYGDPVGLADAVAVTPYIKVGAFCPC